MSEIDTINENSYLSFVRQTYVQYAFIIIIGTVWTKPNKS